MLFNLKKVNMPTKSEAFIQEFVLSFGFFGGLFTYVGVDPEEEIIRTFLKLAIPNHDAFISLLMILIGIVVTLIGIGGTYAAAGKEGLVVVAFAWVAGFIIAVGGSYSVIGALLLVAVLIVGPFVYDNHHR